ncbi:MAG: nuclear transport factor 2 family protein [Alphaproteobacteria bacterium]|uniref:nuclear transport factor 2 family protein n=1 Tax=Brevundimonas sp. TaxID=1871086 RepID=UPI00184199D5|nr:nuclear transport factor 2 family protein [Brevundimonas sp.]MBA3049373.1 nuclear transport factor 2 family protein [Brevundimonas sp.]MBU3974013.1 nuclear transport factor 2 family protein [Alphaproteobacteria bacterium]MBU4136246.1 nuclear transport factor 2 family protein [Alphaproteobacteria bacterium]
MHRLVALTLPAVLFAAPALAQIPDAAPIVAAERAFAADAPSMGVAGSFNKWSVPEAIVIGGGQAQRIGEAYPDGPRPADEPLLEWWPNFAGIARSGDLGFTTGGVAVNGRRTGHYFTVWKKQPDGSWRWVYDGGSGASAADVPGPDSEPVILPVGPQLLQVVTSMDRPPPPMAPDWAMTRVREQEAALARAAVTDQKAAHLAAMADNGRLYVAPRPPAIGRDAFAEALDGWPATFRFGPTEGGGQSQYGDLVWTYGPAAWTRDGQERTGHYVRLWQRQEGGFRIVLAQLIPAPPPAPPPAGS